MKSNWKYLYQTRIRAKGGIRIWQSICMKAVIYASFICSCVRWRLSKDSIRRRLIMGLKQRNWRLNWWLKHVCSVRTILGLRILAVIDRVIALKSRTQRRRQQSMSIRMSLRRSNTPRNSPCATKVVNEYLLTKSCRERLALSPFCKTREKMSKLNWFWIRLNWRGTSIGLCRWKMEIMLTGDRKIICTVEREKKVRNRGLKVEVLWNGCIRLIWLKNRSI